MKTTLKGAPAIVGSYTGGNVIQQMMVANGLEGLEPGHAVLITDGVVTERWDGVSNTTRWAGSSLGIVTAKQFEGDSSVSVIRFGVYLRDRIVLADDSALTAANEFTLSYFQLFAEGAWL
ncbi:hypothetical protein QF117_12235 [Vibrio sp. YMD68]|uniref:hypothetical protein n=1 Tax=Vibrio sp. YMD68 TaxID=3042300 RepID=UPI00249CCC75|nr:hypothetical protein [Vibrio sp. YMD68]WGW01546.1 hypothetical protein QF117_12235 [Vibrio sp. YMD68]